MVDKTGSFSPHIQPRFLACRAMAITWRLEHPMPAEFFEEMKVAAG